VRFPSGADMRVRRLWEIRLRAVICTDQVKRRIGRNLSGKSLVPLEP